MSFKVFGMVSVKWARSEITFPFWVRSEYKMNSSERVGRFDSTVESVKSFESFELVEIGSLKLASKGGFNLVVMSVGAVILCNGFFMKLFDPEIRDFL